MILHTYYLQVGSFMSFRYELHIHRPYNLLNSNYLSFQKIRIRKYNGNKGVKFVLIRNEHSSSLNSFFLANQGERMNEICKFDPLLSDGSGDFFGEKIQLQSTNVDFEFCHHTLGMKVIFHQNLFVGKTK